MEQLELFESNEYVLIPKKEKTFEEEYLESLYREAQRFSRRHWGLEFDGIIQIVHERWRKRVGCYIPYLRLIQVSIYHLKKYSYSYMIDTLHHELVHWYLHSERLPYSDTDEEFIKECIRVGASLSGEKKAQEAYQRFVKRDRADVGRS